MSNFEEFIKINGLRKNEVASFLGTSNAFITQLVQGTRTLPNDKLALIKANDGWDYSMLGDGYNSPYSSDSPDSPQYRLVPFINIDAVGGMHTLNEVAISDPQYTIGTIPFIDARDGDICIPVTGKSMIPTYPPGCILLIRKVERWNEYFGYGHSFVLFLNDGRRIIKEITRYDENPKEYVLCRSHNQSFPPEELPKNMIAEVYKVIASLNKEAF